MQTRASRRTAPGLASLRSVRGTVIATLFGREVRCLDFEWLIRTKRAAGRPRDFEAIAEVEALREGRSAGRLLGA